jgi:hypothetical protein
VVSGCGFVLVDETAEDRSTPDQAVYRIGDRRFGPGWMQLQRSMGTSGVVVRSVGGQHVAQVSLSEDQHPIGDFGADGQNEAFGEAVRPRLSG